jgi:hypothetical protein
MFGCDYSPKFCTFTDKYVGFPRPSYLYQVRHHQSWIDTRKDFAEDGALALRAGGHRAQFGHQLLELRVFLTVAPRREEIEAGSFDRLPKMSRGRESHLVTSVLQRKR